MRSDSASSPAGGAPTSRRRRARELALQILFQTDAAGDPLERGIAAFWESQGVPSPDIRGFAEDLVRGVGRHRDGIDGIVTAASDNWEPERMALVDRAILRLAVFELLHREDIPPKVTMNEYIEIAKKFSTEESGAFVNGILDRIWREHGAAPAPGR